MKNMWSLTFGPGRSQPPLSIVLLFSSCSTGAREMNFQLLTLAWWWGAGYPSTYCLARGLYRGRHTSASLLILLHIVAGRDYRGLPRSVGPAWGLSAQG